MRLGLRRWWVLSGIRRRVGALIALKDHLKLVLFGLGVRRLPPRRSGGAPSRIAMRLVQEKPPFCRQGPPGGS